MVHGVVVESTISDLLVPTPSVKTKLKSILAFVLVITDTDGIKTFDSISPEVVS